MNRLQKWLTAGSQNRQPESGEWTWSFKAPTNPAGHVLEVSEVRGRWEGVQVSELRSKLNRVTVKKTITSQNGLQRMV